MFCQNFSGFKQTIFKGASCNRTLAFFKQIRWQVGADIFHSDCISTISDVEEKLNPFSSANAVIRHQTAEAKDLTGQGRKLCHLSRRAKQIDSIAQRKSDKGRGAGQTDQSQCNDLDASLFFEAPHYGNTGAIIKPAVSAQPNIKLAFCKACPDEPLVRLSKAAITTTRP